MSRHSPGLGVTIVAGAIVAFAVVAGIFLWLDRVEAPPIVIDDPLYDQTVTVMVDGAVAAPGVVTLPATARVADAIEAVGGATAKADLSTLNLAARVFDQQRIVVPEVGSRGLASPVAGKLDLNRASQADLEALPGIGPTLASRIIAYREQVGPFTSVDELAQIDGISDDTLEKIRDLVTVGP